MDSFQLSSLFHNLGKLAGITGFACLSLLLISGDTARFFDRYLGLDRIIKFQRKFSLVTALLVILHPVFFILSDKTAATYLLPDFSLLPLALGAISLYIFIAIMTASLLYKRISYSAWQYIHILTYMLFFFSLYHAFKWGSNSSSEYIKIFYAILLLGMVAGMVYRTQYKIRKYYSGKFYVKNIKWETHDTFSLILTAPRNFNFKAGQFCFLRLSKDNLHARHPFTISSSPREHNLKFTIKNTGRFTAVASKLNPDEQIFVDGPFGTFTLKNSDKDLVFIAGGVGITPFSSMINENYLAENKRNITLLYGSRTEKDIIFKREFDGIKEYWFKKDYVLSDEDGYINEATIEKYVKDIDNSLFYICGPEVMKEGVKRALHNLGVKKQNIKTENFFW